MAITLIQQPKTNTSAWNEQWWTATSDKTAQPNFQFYVTTTVYYYNGSSWTSTAYNEAIDKPTDSVLRFDSSPYAKNYVANNYFPNTSSTFDRCTNGVVKVVVNIGEKYGSTPTVYAGSNTTYYAWNAAFNYLEYSNILNTGSTYINITYLCNNGSAFKLFNDTPDLRTTSTSQNYIYLMGTADNVIKKAIVTSTDGAPIPTGGTFTINNTYYNTGNWYDRYVCLRVDPTYLAAKGGANWVGVAGTSYTIDLYDNTNTLQYTLTLNYDTVCSRFTRYMVSYLNRKGAFDWFYFNMVSEEEYDVSRITVKNNVYKDPTASGVQAYNIYDAQTRVYNTELTRMIKLNSDWISESQSTTLLDLISSPVVYIQDLANGSTIYQINNSETKYKINKKFNNKIWQLSMQFQYSYTSNRQRGV